MQLSGPVVDLSEGDKNAFSEALKIVMDSMFREYRRMKNVLLHGYGASVIGTVGSTNATTGSSNIVLNDDIWPISNFYPNQVLDFYTSDAQTTFHGTLTVVSVNYATRTLGFSGGTSSTTANDVIVISGNNTTAAPQGLLGIIDDGTYNPGYFGSSRTTYPGLNATIQVGTGASVTKYGNVASLRRAISEDLIQQGIDQQQIVNGTDQPVDLLYSDLGVRRQYWLSLVGDRRYENNWVYDGGWKMLRYYSGDVECSWMASEFCTRYQLFGMYTGTKRAAEGQRPAKIQDEEILALYQAPWGGAKWDEATGNQLKQIYSGASLVDAVGAFLKDYYNFASCNPGTMVRWDDFLET